jgi:hypothetical protein
MRCSPLFGFESIGKTLLMLGGVIIFVGLIFMLIDKIGLARLPGDIVIKRENLTVFFPLTTMIIVSIVLTVLLNIWRRF